MKRTIIHIATFVALLLATLSVLSAQESEPTPKTKPTILTLQPGAQWSRLRNKIFVVEELDDNQKSLITNTYFYNDTETFKLDKTKVIDGKIYFELKDPLSRQKMVYLREDLDEGKIYAYGYFKGDSFNEILKETVLFDYNCKVGDMVPVYSDYDRQDFLNLDPSESPVWGRGPQQLLLLRVTRIETKHLLNADRLVYTFERIFLGRDQIRTNLETYYWIEGVGFSFGFLFYEDSIGMDPGISFYDFKPLCYTSSEGDVYRFHPFGVCEFHQSRSIQSPASQEDGLDVQITRDKLGLTIGVDDDKHHDLTIYRYDGTLLLGTTSFYQSYPVALPTISGEKILIMVDGETIPYVL